jgi:hypothetical protein
VLDDEGPTFHSETVWPDWGLIVPFGRIFRTLVAIFFKTSPKIH